MLQKVNTTVFSSACHRHGWLPGLAHDAVIYAEELPYHHDQIARFIPEFVMAQLESAAALDRLPFTTTRNLVVVLIETGLRGGDACSLAFSPTLDDSAGWPWDPRPSGAPPAGTIPPSPSVVSLKASAHPPVGTSAYTDALFHLSLLHVPSSTPLFDSRKPRVTRSKEICG